VLGKSWKAHYMQTLGSRTIDVNRQERKYMKDIIVINK
jgi:hypothetical protein